MFKSKTMKQYNVIGYFALWIWGGRLLGFFYQLKLLKVGIQFELIKKTTLI